MDFTVPAVLKVEFKKSEKMKEYLNFVRELKKKEDKVNKITEEHEEDVDTNCSWCVWNSLQRFGKKTG